MKLKCFYILYKNRKSETFEMKILATNARVALSVLRSTYGEEDYGADYLKTYNISERETDKALVIFDHEVEDFDLEGTVWTPFE